MKRFALPIVVVALVGYWHSPVSYQDQNANTPEERIYNGAEVDRKASILFKPEATFTWEARRQNVVGIVEMLAVFAANGQVKDIEVRKRLPAGLTEQALEAARKITFIPAIKDGNPVSQRMVLEYRFDLVGKIIHGQRFPKLYYRERCRDYSNIAPDNMIFFTSEQEAKRAGYKRSKICP